MNVARNITLCISDPGLHAALPCPAILAPAISDTAMWLLDGETPFGLRIRQISDSYQFIDKFRPGVPVFYFYSSKKEAKPLVEGPPRGRVRPVTIHVATNDRVGAALRKIGVDFVEQNLDYGDVAFTTDGKLIELVIERKEKSDFVSSITDGRLAMQSAVMTQNFADHAKFLYFIEGNPLETQYGPNEKAKLANIVYPFMRKGTSAVIGEDVHATAQFIAKIHYLLENAPEEKLREKGFVLGREMNAGVKKAELVGQNKFRHLVLLVPGIGEKIADSIVKELDTFSKMREVYVSRGEMALENVAVTGVEGRNRVGKAASRKIFEFFEFGTASQGTKKRKIDEDAE